MSFRNFLESVSGLFTGTENQIPPNQAKPESVISQEDRERLELMVLNDEITRMEFNLQVLKTRLALLGSTFEADPTDALKLRIASTQREFVLCQQILVNALRQKLHLVFGMIRKEKAALTNCDNIDPDAKAHISRMALILIKTKVRLDELK